MVDQWAGWNHPQYQHQQAADKTIAEGIETEEQLQFLHQA